MAIVRRVASDDLRAEEVSALRDLFDAAWKTKDAEFTEIDRQNAFGGVHFIVEQEGRIVSHGSVIERELHTADLRLTAGFVEAVATLPSRQGRGHASTVMRDRRAHRSDVPARGAWHGHPRLLRTAGVVRVEGTDVRADGPRARAHARRGRQRARSTYTHHARLDPTASLSCDWRPGDVW